MPINVDDVQIRLSGGAANALPGLSLGGAKSSQPATNALFDDVTGAEAIAGTVEYRCVYVHNADAARTITNIIAWMHANTPSSYSQIEIGLGTSAVAAVEQSVANELAPPVGVTFAAAPAIGSGVSMGALAPGQSRALWLRRTISPLAVGIDADTYELRVAVDSPV